MPATHANNGIVEMARTFRLLGDSTRLAMIRALLAGRERNVGWLAAQLGWEIFQALAPETIDLKNREGKTRRIDLQEREGSAITSFMAHSGALEFCVKMAGCGDLLEVCRGARGENHTHQLLPSGENDPVKLVTEELMRGGPHQVYVNAIEKVRSLL